MSQVSTFNQVKLHNVSLIKKALRPLPYTTKNLLAQLTGLSITTCNTIVNELLETGELLPADAVPAYVGRHPKGFCFNKDFSYLCCIFPMLADKKRVLHFAVLDLLGNVLKQDALPMDSVCGEDISALVRRLIKEEPRIHYLSVGVPGYNLNSVIDSCTIQELNGENLVKRLQETFQIPVYIENDMNAIAYGSYVKYRETPSDPSGFVTIASFKNIALGAGAVLNGRIIQGFSNFAGEIFYLRHTRDEVNTIVFSDVRKATIELVSEAFKCYCVTLNPSTIILTGEEITEDIIKEIKTRCLKNIPQRHMPRVIQEENYLDAFLTGLTQIVFDDIF